MPGPKTNGEGSPLALGCASLTLAHSSQVESAISEKPYIYGQFGVPGTPISPYFMDNPG